jgi:ATP-binding cassette, subfamily B, bacterial PglK
LQKNNLESIQNLLDKNTKRKLLLLASAQLVLSFLDLIGIGLLGVIGALTVNGIQSKPSTGKLKTILDFLSIDNFSFQTQFAFLGVIVGVLFISKSLLSLLILKKINLALGNASTLISNKIFEIILKVDIEKLKKHPPQFILYSVTTSVNYFCLNILGGLISFATDGITIFIIFLGLLVIDPLIAIYCLVIFSSYAFVLGKLLHKKSRALGQNESKASVVNNEVALDALSLIREVKINNLYGYFMSEFYKSLSSVNKFRSQISFISNVNKYGLEILLVVSALTIGAFEFMTKNALQAFAGFAIFLAAATRSMPSVLRMQNSLIQIRSGAGLMDPLVTILEIKSDSYLGRKDLEGDQQTTVRDSIVVLNEVEFHYSDTSELLFSEVNLSIKRGEFIGIVGESGAGKSTLLNIILGLMNPSKGEVLIEGIHPSLYVEKYPNAISLVSQDTTILRKNLYENIALGLEERNFNFDKIQAQIKLLKLEKLDQRFFENSSEKINGPEGISGGQRQRVGIARALYRDFQILVLDEPTSSLDDENTDFFKQVLLGLNGKTRIVVTHDKNFLIGADNIYELKNRKLTRI